MAQNPTRQVHALLGGFVLQGSLRRKILLQTFQYLAINQILETTKETG